MDGECCNETERRYATFHGPCILPSEDINVHLMYLCYNSRILENNGAGGRREQGKRKLPRQLPGELPNGKGILCPEKKKMSHHI